MPSLGGIISNFWMNYTPKIRVLGLVVNDDFTTLACIVLTHHQHVTDGQTFRRWLVQGSA